MTDTSERTLLIVDDDAPLRNRLALMSGISFENPNLFMMINYLGELALRPQSQKSL